MQPIPAIISLVAHIAPNPLDGNSLSAIPTFNTALPTSHPPSLPTPKTEVLTIVASTLVDHTPGPPSIVYSDVFVTLTVAPSAASSQPTPTKPTTTDVTTTTSEEFKLYSPTNTAPLVPEKKENCGEFHVIVARGANADYGSVGAMRGLVDLIVEKKLMKNGKEGGEKIKTNAIEEGEQKDERTGLVHFHEVKFPATSEHYDVSVQEGAAEVKRLLNVLTINSTCKALNSPIIVMMGFGQGAQILQDAMCGGGATRSETPEDQRTLGAYMEGMDDVVRDRVVAVIQYSDPRKQWNSLFTQIGSSKHDGILPRKIDLTDCTAFTISKFRTYCDTGDPLCDSGNNTAINAEYYSKTYDEAAYGFIKGKMENFRDDLKAAGVNHQDYWDEYRRPDGPKGWGCNSDCSGSWLEAARG